MNILHVDDEADWRELVALALAALPQAGTLRQFADGRAAVDALARDAFDADLVLLDFHLRGTNGLQVLRELRARSCSVPVAILTAGMHAAEQALCLEAGAVAVIDKAVRREALVRALHALMESLATATN
jgi:DNA-binding response OmpR family regulator